MYISGDNPCLSCILNNPQKIREIFINSEKSNIYKQLIEKHKLNGITKYLPKKELLKIDKEDKRSSNDIIIRRDKYTSVSLGEIVRPKPKNSLIILIDQLNDQNNLGNIIRTSSLIGADGIIIPEHSSAQINNITSTTSSGAIEVLKFNISKNISRTLEDLKKLGYWTYSLDITGEILTKKFNFDKRTALIVGNEGRGIRKNILNKSDFKIKIPQEKINGVDSYNAANSLAIALYHYKISS
jgi:23S rRNA (guanosine2251-2'-O)-methyltransferase